MAVDPERMKRLNVASAFCMFDKRLSSSGNGSIIWGVLNLLIGGGAVAAGHILGGVSVLLGVALLVAGIYEKRVRDAKVIIVSAATLALLALWDFALIGLAAMGRAHLALGGRTLYWGIAQAAGAYATWKTYATYKMLRAEADPLLVQQVSGYIDELKKAKPGQSLDMVEFDANAGFVQGTNRYRLKPLEDQYLVARYRVQLGSMKLEEVTFVPRGEVRITPEGAKRGKKIKARVQLGPVDVSRVTITPDMAARIDPNVAAMALSLG